MKTYLAIAAATALSSAGIYGTDVIWGSDQTSLFEAELAGDQNANAVYPMALDDVYSKLISTPIIDAVGQNNQNDFAPQIIISTQNNRQIKWQIKLQNQYIGDVVVNLAPESDTTRATFDVTIAENSILTAATASTNTSATELKKMSRLMIALLIDHRLTGREFNDSEFKAAFASNEITNLDGKITAIQHIMYPWLKTQQPPIEYIEPDEQDDDLDVDYSPESVTNPTDATIGEVDEETAATDAAFDRVEHAKWSAERVAEHADRMAAQADRMAAKAGAAAQGAEAVAEEEY